MIMIIITQWRAEGGGRGAWPPGASLGGGAGPAYRGESPKTFFFFSPLVDFISQEEMLIMGGGRRCKHWPPGAGDPRYATVIIIIGIRV